MKRNTILSKTFWYTLLWKQNAHHRHGVLVHTLRVAWYAARAGKWRMVPAALLHDIGKPVVAYQKPEDIEKSEYSFTNHEEVSYCIIAKWPFVGEYTKALVRWHYLLRDIEKHRTKKPNRAKVKTKKLARLSPQMQEDLRTFLVFDDKAKGKK
jgi:HD-like signal output (HDOD) protein